MTTMNKLMIEKITESVVCFVETAKNFETAPRYYVDDELLYSSEIHIIDTVGRNHGEHLSEIARRFGVTKGAASQLIKKLEKKGYVYKELDDTNQTRMKVLLTDKGREAFDKHIEFHAIHHKGFGEFLSKQSDQNLDNIFNFLNELQKFYK